MAPQEPEIQTITCDFEIHIDERYIELDRDIQANRDITDVRGYLDLDRLIVALNQEQVPNQEIFQQFIKRAFQESGFERHGFAPLDDRIRRVFDFSGSLVTNLRFARGSIQVLGHVTVILSDPVVREIAKDALIAVATQGIQKGAARGLEYLLRSFGVKLHKPIGNVQIVNINAPGAQVTLNPLHGTPIHGTPTSDQSSKIAEISPLTTLIRLNTWNVIISLAILLALILYIFRVLP